MNRDSQHSAVQPSKLDISPTNGEQLDEMTAVENFFGKSRSEAAELFFQNSIFYENDLKWMGDVGFMYYFPCLLPYLMSVESRFDSDVLEGIVATVELRFSDSWPNHCGFNSEVLEVLDYCISNYSKFEVDSAIYPNLKNRLFDCVDMIKRLWE